MPNTHSLKVGDRVEYVGVWGTVPIGTKGTISKTPHIEDISVNWDGIYNGHGASVVSESLKLIPKVTPKPTKEFSKGDRVQWRKDGYESTFDGTVTNQKHDQVEVQFDDFGTRQWHPTRHLYLITPMPKDNTETTEDKFFVVSACRQSFDTKDAAVSYVKRELNAHPGRSFIVTKGVSQYETENVMKEIAIG